MPLSSQPYEGPADLEAMIDLLLAVRPRHRVADWPGVVELQEVMQRPAVTAHTRLWHGTDELSAWAFVDEFSNLHFERRGGPAGDDLADAIIAWAGDVVRSGWPDEGGATLDASTAEDDRERIDLLLRHGFECQPTRTLHYVRSLDVPLPEPVLPPGFTIRPLGAGEVAAAAALHRAAFGTGHMTFENRLAMMAGPDYDPLGDLVVVAPDGQLAAYTMASMSAGENLASGRMDGFTDPVATHPAFRRQGLARVLLLHGCAYLASRGATRVRLGTSSENLAMQAAAESAGYRVESARLWLSRSWPSEARPHPVSNT